MNRLSDDIIYQQILKEELQRFPLTEIEKNKFLSENKVAISQPPQIKETMITSPNISSYSFVEIALFVILVVFIVVSELDRRHLQQRNNDLLQMVFQLLRKPVAVDT